MRPAASKAEANGWATSEFRGDSWTGVVFRLAHSMVSLLMHKRRTRRTEAYESLSCFGNPNRRHAVLAMMPQHKTLLPKHLARDVHLSPSSQSLGFGASEEQTQAFLKTAHCSDLQFLICWPVLIGQQHDNDPKAI